MSIRLIREIGGGAFGDVWEGKDDTLDRRVAVKVLRSSSATDSQVLYHARALAQAAHHNVITVYSIERIDDDVNDVHGQAIIMEYFEGETLASLLRGPELPADRTKRIGDALIAGVRHLHGIDLGHGDLHAENVLVSGDAVKIIDILLLTSISRLSTKSVIERCRLDTIQLRLLLSDLLKNSTIEPSAVFGFESAIGTNPTLDDLDNLFSDALSPDKPDKHAIELRYLVGRCSPPIFVGGKEYACAVSDETPMEMIPSLLIEMVRLRSITHEHRELVRLLWLRMEAIPSQRSDVLAVLAQRLDEDVPGPKAISALNVLAGLDKSGWLGLRKTTRVRLEKIITDNVLAGRFSYAGPVPRLTGGHLGTLANRFWLYFEDKDTLLENILALLNQSWDRQNYVGEYFLPLIAKLASTPDKRAFAIIGIVAAMRANAFSIRKNVTKQLPADWSVEIGNILEEESLDGPVVFPKDLVV